MSGLIHKMCMALLSQNRIAQYLKVDAENAGENAPSKRLGQVRASGANEDFYSKCICKLKYPRRRRQRL